MPIAKRLEWFLEEAGVGRSAQAGQVQELGQEGDCDGCRNG